MLIEDQKWWRELCKKAEMITRKQLGLPLTKLVNGVLVENSDPIPAYVDWPPYDKNGFITHRNGCAVRRD